MGRLYHTIDGVKEVERLKAAAFKKKKRKLRLTRASRQKNKKSWA